MMAASRSRASSWPDLPPELLGLVLERLPSLADRVRLRAVCKPWGSNTWLQPVPPPLPWLTLPNGTFLSIPCGEIHRMPIADDACCYGSIDSWIFLVHRDGKCSLVNPLSKDTIELPDLATICGSEIDAYTEFRPDLFCKLVVPSPLCSSPDSIIAIMHDFGRVCICQPPVVTDRVTREFIYDILFFDGKLYALGGSERLLILEMGEGIGSKLEISSIKCVIDSGDDLLGIPETLSKEGTYQVKLYLVESAGRLLMVRRWICKMGPPPSHDFIRLNLTCALEVFEADLSAMPSRWRRVSQMGGQALFIGSHCSKSFPAGECSGVQDNCIYYMNDYHMLQSDADPLRDSGVYNLINGDITPLLSGSSTAPINLVGDWRPTWVFPTEAI